MTEGEAARVYIKVMMPGFPCPRPLFSWNIVMQRRTDIFRHFSDFSFWNIKEHMVRVAPRLCNRGSS